jgi:hypothetical protein
MHPIHSGNLKITSPHGQSQKPFAKHMLVPETVDISIWDILNLKDLKPWTGHPLVKLLMG